MEEDEKDVKEAAEQMAELFKAGAGWSIEALTALVKAGVPVGDKTSFFGLLTMAYGVGRTGAEVSPSEFAAMARVVAETAQTISHRAGKAQRGKAIERAKEFMRDLGKEVSPELEEEAKKLLEREAGLPHYRLPDDEKVH